MKIQQLILTHRNLGKGVDPARAGFIVAACSPGIGDKLRHKLEVLCSSLGQVVQARPESADRALQAWRDAQTDPFAPITEEVLRTVLKDCPIVWSYSAVEDGLFALVRGRYIGLTNEGAGRRSGNFLTHALVLRAEDLAPVAHNPLALARSVRFWNIDDERVTILPELDAAALPAAPGGSAADDGNNGNDALDGRSPWSGKLPQLLAGLCDISGAGKRLVLCIPEWKAGRALVESLLGLLPPGARSRTTFTTFQLGALPSPVVGMQAPQGGMLAAPGAESKNSSPPQIVLACGREVSKFGLTDVMYEGIGYTVMNFVDNRFTPVRVDGGYVSMRAGAGAAGKPSVERLDAWTLALGLGADQTARQAWDKLVAVAEVERLDADPAATSAALATVVDVAASPQQAEGALRHLRKQITDLARGDSVPALEALVPGLATLADRASTAQPPACSVEHARQLSSLALDAFGRGRYRTADLLLQACGAARKDQLLEVIRKWLSPAAPTAGPTAKPGGAAAAPAAPAAANGASRDQAAVLARLLEEVIASPAARDLPQERLLVETLRAAGRAGTAGEVWERLHQPVVQRLFDAMPEKGRREFLDTLLTVIPVQQCPAGRLWVGLTLLGISKSSGEPLMVALEEQAKVVGGGPNTAALGRLLTDHAGKLISDPLAQAEALARMCQHLSDGLVRGEFWALFKSARDNVDASALLRRLVAAKAAPILADELYESVIPWEDGRSDSALKKWKHDLKEAGGIGLLDPARSRIARRSGREALELMAGLLPCDKRESELRGFAELYAAVIRLMDLLPKTAGNDRRAVLDGAPPNLPADVKARFDVMQFLLDVETQSASPGWSIADFRSDDKRWVAAGTLEPGDREQALGYCAAKISQVGIRSARDVEALVGMTRAAGEPDVAPSVLRRVDSLLTGRDPVTCVNVLTAFADKALEDGNGASLCGDLFVRALGGLDRTTTALLADHLGRRFCQPTPQHRDTLARLCQQADIPAPSWVDLAQSQSQTPSWLGAAGKWLVPAAFAILSVVASLWLATELTASQLEDANGLPGPAWQVGQVIVHAPWAFIQWAISSGGSHLRLLLQGAAVCVLAVAGALAFAFWYGSHPAQKQPGWKGLATQDVAPASPADGRPAA